MPSPPWRRSADTRTSIRKTAGTTGRCCGASWAGSRTSIPAPASRSSAITEKATGNFYIPVANENLNLFDADLTVLFPIFLDSSAFANDPLLRAIPSAQEGHLLILDDPALVNAFSSGSVPGLTYAIDNAVPKFASTLGA